MTQKEIQEMQEAVTAFRQVNEQVLTEQKTINTTLGETKEKLEKMHSVVDGLEDKINKRMDAEEVGKKFSEVIARLEQIEAKANRKGAFADPPAEDEKVRQAFAKSALMGALRWNPVASTKTLEETIGPEKVKALILGSDTAGGYLAPTEYVMEMITAAVEYAAIRNLCRIRTTTRTAVQIPKRTQTAVAAWVSETGTRSETTNPAFGMVDIPTHEMYAMTKVSKQELEDSAFDLETFLRDEFSEQFGVAEADAIINGNGVGKPEGLLTSGDITSVNSGSGTDLTPDGLISLYYELKEVYLANASWVMNRSTLKVIRQMKDQQDQYLWAPGIRTDARPAVILDRPYITAPEMPVISAGAYPVLFGDFRRGVIIVDRVVMELMSDPYSSKSTGMVEFSARRRMGAKTALGEAIKKQKVSA